MTDIMTEQALADAALEGEQERVERALAWDRASKRVQDMKAELAHTLEWRKKRFAEQAGEMEWGEHCLHKDAAKLVAALDELERLEGAS